MYIWIKFLHVLSALAFMLAHGASAAVMFRVRAEREPARLHALLDLSNTVGGSMAITSLLLLIFGLVAGFMGSWWGQGWIWAALALLIGISAVMSILGRYYLDRVRRAIGVPTAQDQRKKVKPTAVPPEQLEAVLNAGQPMALAIIGLGGLVVILWLMMFKPF